MIKFFLNFLPRPLLIRLSYWLLPLVDLFYRGKAFYDPINGKSYRKFLPYGYEKKRENALSPGTLSLERHRLFWLFLKHKTKFFTAKKLNVLHLAPEQAFFKKFKNQKNLNYTSCDLEAPHVDVHADICALPFEDDCFDVIFCNHVLEHIPNDHLAMSELYRVMKPGGWGVFQVPISYRRNTTYEDPSITSPEERKKHFGQYDHVRIYGMDFYKRLENAGFQVQKIVLSDELLPKEVKRMGLERGEILPLVLKP